MNKTRRTIAIDFDGVLYSYHISGWKGAHALPDPPMPGAIEFLCRAIQEYNVMIFTTRARSWRGRQAIRGWLKLHSGSLWYPAPGTRGIEEVKVTAKKDPALVYVDDRAIRFDGMFPRHPREWAEQRPWWGGVMHGYVIGMAMSAGHGYGPVETARCDFCQADVSAIELNFEPCTTCGGDGRGSYWNAEGMCHDCDGDGGEYLCDRCYHGEED